MIVSGKVYLDYQATTPMDPRVLESMLPYFNDRLGNPHSRNHAFGWEAEEATEIAREHVANIINCTGHVWQRYIMCSLWAYNVQKPQGNVILVFFNSPTGKVRR